MGIPERVFYPLHKAALKISKGDMKYDVDDLLHFAEMGMVEILIRATGDWAATYSIKNKNNLCVTYTEETPFHSCCPSITVYYEKNHDKEWREFQDKFYYESDICLVNMYAPHGDNRNTGATIDGLMALDLKGERKLIPMLQSMESILLPELFVSPPSSYEGAGISLSTEAPTIKLNDINLSINQLYISQSEILLLENGGRSISEFSIAKKTINHKEPTQKTINHQLQFIVALLDVYAPESIEKPESSIDGKNGVLKNAFSRAGVDMPIRGRTLANWIKQSKY